MTLKEKYKDYFHIGAAVNVQTIQSHGDILREHFSSLTSENEMKYGEITPDGKTYDFSKADAICGFAKENGMAMRMHTLLWHNQSPPQIFENTDRTNLLRTLEEHIQVMARRYGDAVYACDVANEVIVDPWSDKRHSGAFRKSPWIEIIGEDFCDQAFIMAKKAMPEVAMFYNDYCECDPEKSVNIANFVRGMVERGVPVDGIGLQCHWSIHEPGFEDIRRAMELYAGLGLQIHITEMDISYFAARDSKSIPYPTEEMVERQADLYERAFALFREYKECVTSVTTWGVADDETWLDSFPQPGRKNWPLLFDEKHQAKEAVSRIMNF